MENASRFKATFAPTDFFSFLSKVVGSANIICNGRAFDEYLMNTAPWNSVPWCIVKPKLVTEIQEIVRLCAEHKVGISPISRGKNWGYGTAAPYRDGDVILDLSRMNRVIEINDSLAYVVIEPGISQGELASLLLKSNSRLRIDPSGAGPFASVVGNILERGGGMGRYGDHVSALCGLEVVLPDGEILRTGFWNYEGASSAHTYKWGLGPALNGIFTQSSLGVITKICLWLVPKAQCCEVCVFSLSSEKGIVPITNAIRELLLDGTINTSINLISRTRLLSGQMQYPWDLANGKTPLPKELRDRLAEERNIPHWMGIVSLEGSRDLVIARKRALRYRLSPLVSKLNFFSEKTIALLEAIKFPSKLIFRKDLSQKISYMRSAYGFFNGMPNESTFITAYWRNKKVSPPCENLDPARDHCGLLWFVPVVPLEGGAVENLLGIIDPILRNFGFDNTSAFITSGERSYICTLPILFDLDSSEESRRALICYKTLLQRCEEGGFLPYRVAINELDYFSHRKDSYWNFIRKIKDAIDPEQIIAAGKYG